MSHETKYTSRMLSKFPQTLKFVEDKTDPLHKVIDAGSAVLTILNRDVNERVSSLSIDRGNPVEPSGAYFIDVPDPNTVTILPSGDLPMTVLTTGEFDFLAPVFTGLDFVTDIYPSGAPSSGILGLSYGTDLDEDAWYITSSGSPFLLKYSDLEGAPESIDSTIRTQSYMMAGFDEYLNLELAIVDFLLEDSKVYLTYDDISVPSDEYIFTSDTALTDEDLLRNYLYYDNGTFVGDKGDYGIVSVRAYVDAGILKYAVKFDHEFDSNIVLGSVLTLRCMRKVATLRNIPIELKVIDIINLQDRTNLSSDGIVVDPVDYRVENDRIIFNKTRSDYVPEVVGEYPDGTPFVNYPANYQPDEDFSSTYIVEYTYKETDNPRYITQNTYKHNIGDKGNPIPTT